MRAPRVLLVLVGMGLVSFASIASRAAEVLPEIRADGDLITVDGEPVFLKGVCYSPFIAGEAPGGAFRNVNFQADLTEIASVLNANAVRIYDPLPKAFYDAARAAGIWVIQGFFIPNPPSGDFLDPTYVEERKQVLRKAIDQLHRDGSGDVILAYVLGNGFDTQRISTTIRQNQDAPRYRGTYYSTPAETELPRVDAYRGCGDPAIDQFFDPHPFQSFLAELADAAATHEQEQYGHRHLIGHSTWPNTSAFLGARDRPVPLFDAPVDLGFLDVIFENIHTYGFPYVAYRGMPDYLRLLKIHYPSKPVVVLESGYSTSPVGLPLVPPQCGQPSEPAPLTLTYGGNSEAEQAQAIEARWVDVTTSERPFAGFFVFCYYEEWWYAGDPGAQDEDEPLEFFGIKRVRGDARSFTVSNKPAFSVLAQLYRCDGPAAKVDTCGGIVIQSPTAMDARYGVPFEHTFEIAGGAAPHVVEVLDPRNLPEGVALDAGSGSLRGTPERVGPYRFRLRVTDADGVRQTRVRVLRVAPPVFSTSGKDILMNGEPFYLKGVDYSPFIAGDAPWSDMTHAAPLQDMKEIREVLGCNTIRLYESLPKSVYDAARAYGLFIIQGIHLQVNAPGSGSPECTDPRSVAVFPEIDLYAEPFFQEKKDHVRREIDELNDTAASDLILCYIVGNEVNFCAQRYTIIHHQERPRFKGAYSVPDGPPRLPELDAYPDCEPDTTPFYDPHPFQSFVAELVEVVVQRETELYGAPHLVAHATDPNMSIAVGLKDRYYPHEHFPVDLSFLDIVFQNVYSYFPPYLRFVGYDEYLRLAAEAYPDVPFVILECGYSVSLEREAGVGCAADHPCPEQHPNAAPLSLCFGFNSPRDQALGLARRFEEARAAPGLSAGFFVFEFYDEWWKGAERSEFVHDREKPEEWFGIKSVTGTPEDFEIAWRPAFETVRRMYNTSWCPEVTCTLEAGGVRISLAAAEPLDSVTISRNGDLLATLGRDEPTFLDLDPAPRLHTYSIVATKAHVACPPVECTIVVNRRPEFRRGDVNADGDVNVTDAVNLLGFLFQGMLVPACLDAADANDDGEVNLADGVYTLNHLFGGAAPPPDPGFADGCGPDPTDDGLAFCDYRACAP